MNDSTPWTTKDILDATSGELVCGELKNTFSDIVIDSRKAAPNEFFVAVQGETHDGHTFIKQVIQKGIRGLLVDRKKKGTLPISEWRDQGISCITVSDTTHALGELANYHCRRLDLNVIAITGSNGKTTTRAMTAGVVQEGFCTLATQGNFNNEIGLPLTLFRAQEKHEWAVVELGMNHPGEIRRLTQICRPRIGIITNIAPAHLEGLGSIENVMRAKRELLDELRSDGIAILNGDDIKLQQLAAGVSKRMVLYGQSAEANIRAEAVENQLEHIAFTLKMPEGSEKVVLKTPGEFMVSNALAAAATGFVLDLTPEQIKQGLEEFRPVAGRLNILHLKQGIHVIDDTYNANPSSMQAALNTLAALSKKHRRIAVLGDMNELGEQSDALHKSIGAYTAESGVEKLFICGRYAAAMAEGAKKAGLSNGAIQIGTKEEISGSLLSILEPDDWVLVKASRAVAMDQVVSKLNALDQT